MFSLHYVDAIRIMVTIHFFDIKESALLSEPNSWHDLCDFTDFSFGKQEGNLSIFFFSATQEEAFVPIIKQDGLYP